MKNETRNEGWYGRFLHWAGGEEPDGPEGPEDPERQEFLEYLEYIEAHGDMEFGAYRLMRYRERREKGMEGAQPPASRPAERREVRRPARRRRPGALRRQLRLYRGLSVCVIAVLAGIFLLTAAALPSFGDPEAPAIWRTAWRRPVR